MMTRQKMLRFLIPGRLGSGFLLGVGFMLWLAIMRKPVFDNVMLWVIDFLGLLHS